MTKRVVQAMFAAGLALITQSSAPQSLPLQLQELEPILVTGERPGPALWKVTWRDHTLWILPTLEPLPSRMTWRSKQVEQLLSESQEVFFESSLVMRMGGNGRDDSRVLEALLNPDGRWLSDVLPPDLYVKFAVLNSRYAGNNQRLASFRPFYAALQLREEALRRLQLDGDGQMHDRVAYLARKYHVPLHLLDRELRPRPRTLATRLRRTTAEADVECTRSQLAQLETELRQAVARANAWSTGDIDALRADWAAKRQQDELASCKPLFQQLAPADRAVRETRDEGFKELDKALRRNRVTVALVLLEEVFDPDGVVGRFRAAGYEVAEP